MDYHNPYRGKREGVNEYRNRKSCKPYTECVTKSPSNRKSSKCPYKYYPSCKDSDSGSSSESSSDEDRHSRKHNKTRSVRALYRSEFNRKMVNPNYKQEVRVVERVVEKEAPKPTKTDIISKLEKCTNSDTPSSDNDECQICMENKKNVAIVPCGHMTCCVDCSINTFKDKLECPMCRGEVSDVLTVF